MATNDAGLDIVNSALVRLGAQPIGSLSDLTGQAVTAGRLFRQISQTLLADHFWAFSLRDSQLGLLYQFQSFSNGVSADPIPAQTTPPRNFSAEFVYQLPADCLRVVGLRSFMSWELAGDQLITDDGAAVLVYIADVPPGSWPPWFRELLTLQLASQMAIAVTDQVDRAKYFAGLAESYWRRARAIDSQQTPSVLYDLERIYTTFHNNVLAGS